MRQRFPMSMPVKFSSGTRRERAEGQGEVVDISSSGVAFRTAVELMPGAPIEASMNWPVTLNGDCLLRVTIEGRVVRITEAGLAVMSVDRYEFRTGGRVSALRPEIEAAKRNFAALSTGNPVRAFA
jgi:hypothetical protein